MGPWLVVIGVAAGAVVGAVVALLHARRAQAAAQQRQVSAQGELIGQLGQLAGGLAHEIKNPLSTINVNLKLLSEDLHRFDDEEHKRLLRRLDSVQNEADRLRATLDDFLRFAGKYELDLQPVDLREVVGELVDFFTPQAQSNGVVLRCVPSPEPVICRVDSKILKQALLNLLINANEAMEGSGELLVTLSSQPGRATIAVTDTGPGLPEEQMNRIFDLYYSTKVGGSGLGLPTTRRIANEHGGDIRVESEPGKGTRFAIELPLAD